LFETQNYGGIVEVTWFTGQHTRVAFVSLRRSDADHIASG